jgi:hypothetical protein
VGADDPIASFSIAFAAVQEHWARPAWVNLSGAPRPEDVSLYDSTFSRTVWWLYGGAKGLAAWY